MYAEEFLKMKQITSVSRILQFHGRFLRDRPQLVAAEMLQVKEDDEVRRRTTATIVPAAAEKDATVLDELTQL